MDTNRTTGDRDDAIVKVPDTLRQAVAARGGGEHVTVPAADLAALVDAADRANARVAVTDALLRQAVADTPAEEQGRPRDPEGVAELVRLAGSGATTQDLDAAAADYLRRVGG